MDKPERLKVRAPTLANLLSLCNIADIPVVIAGIDPCIACAEGVTLVDKDNGEKRICKEQDLRYVKQWYRKR